MAFFVFMICLFSGVISGVVYDVLFIARCILCGTDRDNYTVKDKIFIAAEDILYCLVFAAGFIFLSVTFGFESFRPYMFIGCVLGALMYLKSFHVIVAFFVNKVYNSIAVKLNKRPAKEKKSGRAKAQPHGGGNHHKRNTSGGNSRNSRRLSDSGARYGGKKKKRVYRGNRKNKATD